jgi:chromosome segregation ATPase
MNVSELVEKARDRDEARREVEALRAERDHAIAQRDKALADLAGLDGRLTGIHEHFRFELNKACGVNAHLQAHNDHLVEVNASIKSQAAEAGLCRELIAERDALRAEVERLRPLASAEMLRLAILDAMNGGEA